jgi:hypothetical protein
MSHAWILNIGLENTQIKTNHVGPTACSSSSIIIACPSSSSVMFQPKHLSSPEWMAKHESSFAGVWPTLTTQSASSCLPHPTCCAKMAIKSIMFGLQHVPLGQSCLNWAWKAPRVPLHQHVPEWPKWMFGSQHLPAALLCFNLVIEISNHLECLQPSSTCHTSTCARIAKAKVNHVIVILTNLPHQQLISHAWTVLEEIWVSSHHSWRWKPNNNIVEESLK